MNEEQASAYGKVGAKYGAKFGKKAAQSETGRATGRAALKAGTEAAVDDVNQRYLGSPAQQPPQTVTTAPSKTSTSRQPPVQSSRSYTSASSSRQSSSYSSYNSSPQRTSYGSSSDRTSSYKGKSSSKSGGGWNPFKKKEAPVTYNSPTPRKLITKHAITKAGDWDKEVYCYALYNFGGELPCDLQFNKGQRIAIITRTATQDDWWEGNVNGKTGIFPANYVTL